MISMKQDQSMLNKFSFERRPMGVKFMSTKPEGNEMANPFLHHKERRT